MATKLGIITVSCPLCGQLLEIPEYNSVTRTDALAGHIVTVHTSKVLPMPPKDGPPLPKGLHVKWPWKK